METEQNIANLKTRYIDTLYSQTRHEQEEDLAFINDTFSVEAVRKPHKVIRLGLGYEIVNAPGEQIVTSNPQANIEVLKGGKGVEERLSRVLNGWIDVLRRQNPNPFKESVSNKLGRGENYIKVAHNEDWVTKGQARFGLPVFFLVPDPMVIYGSPEEDDDGVPSMVLVAYKRQSSELIARYPWWRPEKDEELVEWFEYWDADTKQFEIDGVIVLRKPNIYGRVPFVRRYSGLGRRSPDGELSNLIMSDIRNSRGLIEEICVMESDIASNLHLSAHKPKLILAAGKVRREQVQELKFGTYKVNIIDELGDLSQFQLKDLEIDQPTIQAFQHLASLKADLRQRHPYIMAGFPMGTSGRQQGMTDVAAMRRYDTVVENTETEWATAFEMALKICQAVPTLVPAGLQKSDLEAVIKCEVKLKAKDPIEEDRLITLGDRLRRLPNPGIDIETFHTQFMGYTKEDSKKIQAKMLADMVTIYNPDVASVMGMVAAEESGMERWLEMARERRATIEKQQRGLEGMPPATTQERAMGEVETEAGREYPVESIRGARKPPTRYVRGGI